jgi:peptidoglycan/LPS O-acetylase OafA/YrhL
MRSSETRLVPLEAFRGMAACIVLVMHFFLGFSPYTLGVLENARNSESLVGQPYFAFFNGTGAIIFFFTLSGFVLCWSYFNEERPEKLILAFLKRFPRLAGIVVVTTVASYGLFKFGLYYFEEAAQVSASPWLATFASSGWTPEFEPAFHKAVIQGLTTFFTGNVTYNSNLWTMQPEFFGSMIVYMLAGFLSMVLGYRHLLYAFAILSISALGFNQHLLPFIVGLFLSVYLAKRKTHVPLGVSMLLIAAGLYMLGYLIPEKAYAWVSHLDGMARIYFQTAFHTLGSACLIFAVMANRRLFEKLNGGLFKLLGRLSFPLYLVHTPVICSVSSYVYLQMTTAQMSNRIILITVFLVTAVVSIGFALLLSQLDEWWVKKVNDTAKQWVRKNLDSIALAPAPEAPHHTPGPTVLSASPTRTDKPEKHRIA